MSCPQSGQNFFTMSRPVNRHKQFVARMALAIMELRAAAEQLYWIELEEDFKQEIVDVAFGLNLKMNGWKDKHKQKLHT